ncbi:MAG: WG repeat-containing protein [Pyrinomonadaceae bacterium]|nr:WG repeat-containing protein [Pyrinomonadaceae bacterium]
MIYLCSERERPRTNAVVEFTSGLARCANHMTVYLRVFTLLVLVSPLVCAQASDSEAPLAIIQNGKMGFISRTGEIVIRPQFDTPSYLGVNQFSEFSEGMAAVKLRGVIGYIDTSGQFVIVAQFKEGRKFCEGMAAVRIGDRWGYINQRGAVVIAPQFKRAGDFSDGVAQVEAGGKFGYMDKTGKFVIEPRFSRPQYPDFVDHGDFKDGVANVMEGRRHLMIDHTGKTVGKCVFDCLTNFHDGMALIQGYKNRRPVLGYMDKNGTIAIEPTYGDAGRFSEGLVQVKYEYGNLSEEKGWFYIDRTGHQAIKGTFFFAGSFSEGLAAVARDNYIKTGYIDRAGTMIIKAQFDRAGRFRGGIARVLVGNKWGYIDKTGNYIWEPSK